MKKIRFSKWLPVILEAERLQRPLIRYVLDDLGWTLQEYRRVADAQTLVRRWQRAGCPPRPVRKDKGGKHKPGGGRPRKKPENKSPI